MKLHIRKGKIPIERERDTITELEDQFKETQFSTGAKKIKERQLEKNNQGREWPKMGILA